MDTVKKPKFIGYYIDRDMHKTLRILSAELDISLRNIQVKALQDWIRRNQKSKSATGVEARDD